MTGRLGTVTVDRLIGLGSRTDVPETDYAPATVTGATTAGGFNPTCCLYPCVVPFPVSFCLFVVYVRFLLIFLLVKFLFNEEADISPREVDSASNE